jgi:hypothetical protein
LDTSSELSSVPSATASDAGDAATHDTERHPAEHTPPPEHTLPPKHTHVWIATEVASRPPPSTPAADESAPTLCKTCHMAWTTGSVSHLRLTASKPES